MLINHNTIISGYKSLRAIPISGTVQVQIYSNNTLIGQTTTKSSGEWVSSIELNDGNYLIKFNGLFHPIGEGPDSHYLTRTTSVEIPLTISSSSNVLTLGNLSSVLAGTPRQNVFFGSDGVNWLFLSIKDYLVDLASDQKIAGLKTFESVTFSNTVTFYGRIIIKNSQNNEAQIYLSSGNQLVFTDPQIGKRSLSSLTKLSEMSDVLSLPSAGTILIGDGTKWASVLPDTGGFVTKADTQTISGTKTFSNVILNGSISGSCVDTDLNVSTTTEGHIPTSLAVKEYIAQQLDLQP